MFYYGCIKENQKNEKTQKYVVEFTNRPGKNMYPVRKKNFVKYEKGKIQILIMVRL